MAWSPAWRFSAEGLEVKPHGDYTIANSDNPVHGSCNEKIHKAFIYAGRRLGSRAPGGGLLAN